MGDMEDESTAAYGQLWSAYRELKFKDRSPLGTLLVCALLLAFCCLSVCYLYRSNRRQRPRVKEPGQYTLIQSAVPENIAPDVGPGKSDEGIVRLFDGPRGQISSLVFLNDGKHIACACKAEKTIQVFNIEDDGEEWPLVNLDVAVNVMSSSKDGELIVTGDADGGVVVWESGFQKKRFEVAKPHGTMITALDVSDSHIASGSNDGTVAVWEIGKPFAPDESSTDRTEDHEHGPVPVSSLSFSPSGKHFASAYAEWGRAIKIWRTRSKELVKSVSMPNNSPTHSLAWSSDGRRLFSGGSGGSIKCFDTLAPEEPSRKTVEPRPGDDSITSLYVSNSDQFLVSFSAPAQTVDLWDIRGTLAHKPLRTFSQCASVSLSPNDLYLVTSGDRNDAKISIRSLSGVVEPSYFFRHLAPWVSDSRPFTYISPSAHRAWVAGKLEQARDILIKEVENERYQGFNCYTRANLALVRTRLGHFQEALDNIDEIMDSDHIPPITQIVKAFALIGQGKQRDAKDVFTSFPNGDANNFVECVKSVILLEMKSRDQPTDGEELSGAPPVTDIHSSAWAKARRLLLLAKHSIQRKEYDKGLQYLADVPDFCPYNVEEAEIIKLVFGWDIYDLDCMVQQLRCQALFASGRTRNVDKFLQVYENPFDEKSEATKIALGWLSEKLGDADMCRRKFDDAITWYSVSFRFCPETQIAYRGSEFVKEFVSVIESSDQTTDETVVNDLALIDRYPPGSARLLVKRSKASGFNGSWDSALEDANQAIKADKSCPWGYERKHAALCALRDGTKANEAWNEMIRTMKNSTDQSVHKLREEYVTLEEKIDKQIKDISIQSPFVLIYVKTGELYNAARREKTFKSDPVFYELISSTKSDPHRIEQIVAKYFRYVMFSHTWEGIEPTFEDISKKSIYEADQDPPKGHKKLRGFCEMVQRDPERYLWAWSDSCCIEESVRKRSIYSMFNWYKMSALTIALLAGDSTTLEDDRWMTRAWTLQELLAPTSIRFYRRNWELYQGDPGPNHKESHRIMEELGKITDIPQDTLLQFTPDSLTIRDKLRLASTRQATWKEDIAYALIGIFSINNLTMEPRDFEDALGLLLQEILCRTVAVRAILDWVGKSSRFNSCLPAQISAYGSPPFTPCAENGIEARVEALRALLPQPGVTKFYEDASALARQPVNFNHGRLFLPCIIFPASIDTLRNDEASSSNQSIVYRVQATALGGLEFKTSSTFRRLDGAVLVYPWIRDLLAQVNLAGSDEYDRALWLITHLEQPFRALLLAKQPGDDNTYNRVAADSEILIPPRTVTAESLKVIQFKTLEIR